MTGRVLVSGCQMPRRIRLIANLGGGSFSTVSLMFPVCNSRLRGLDGGEDPQIGQSGEPPGTVARVTEDESTEPTYPGERLGLPENGPGSVASWPRRFAALIIDWLACEGVAALIWSGANIRVNAGDWYTPLVFLVEVSVLTALLGGSFGQLVMRIVVVQLNGRRLNIVAAILRTVLILLVIPPVVFNRDNRGLHDLAVRSVVVRR